MIEELDAKTIEDLERTLVENGFPKKLKEVIIDYYSKT